jgi:hypothetical protein
MLTKLKKKKGVTFDIKSPKLSDTKATSLSTSTREILNLVITLSNDYDFPSGDSLLDNEDKPTTKPTKDLEEPIAELITDSKKLY